MLDVPLVMGVNHGKGTEDKSTRIWSGGDTNANCSPDFQKYRSDFTKTRHLKRKFIFFLGRGDPRHLPPVKLQLTHLPPVDPGDAILARYIPLYVCHKSVFYRKRLATVHQRHRQDRQRSDSIGQTVLQTVAQKLATFTSEVK